MTTETTDTAGQGANPQAIEQQIIDTLLDGDSGDGAAAAEQPEEGSGADTAGKPAPETKPSAFKPLWDQLVAEKVEVNPEFLKGNFGDGKTEHQALLETIRQGVKPKEEPPVDPFIKGYLETPAEKRGEYIQTYNEIERVMGMDARAGLTYLYQQQKDDKGQRQFSDQEIEEYLGSQTKISLTNEWNRSREVIARERQRALTPVQPTAQEVEARIAQVNTARMDQLKPLLEEELAVETIAGIPYTKELKEDFAQTYSRLNLINPRTGEPYLYQFLEDPKNLRDTMRALVLLKDDKLSRFISDFKEDFKEKTFEKLDPRPKPKPGAASFTPANFPEP